MNKEEVLEKLRGLKSNPEQLEEAIIQVVDEWDDTTGDDLGFLLPEFEEVIVKLSETSSSETTPTEN